jgi:ubiquinone/menaquinone biosynthesis C-methylase UbiE
VHRHHRHHRDHHGNPGDLAEYLAKLEDPARDEWQKPDEVVRALGLRPGQVACDVGAGPGYFALRMARAVSPGGRVYALEAAPAMLEVLRDRLTRAGASNVVPVPSSDGAALPPEPCDVVLMVNAFHHFRDGAGYLRALASRLAPGGRIVNLDFLDRELPVGPPPEMRVSREAFIDVASAAGLELVEEQHFLPYQYFLALRPRGR